MSRAERAPVSVLIPCYRSASTLRRAIRSVQWQSWPVSEIVLVDDGSGDDTRDVMQEVQRELGPDVVKLVFLPRNMGVAAARNAGWAAASHPWLALLDSDDAWHPRKIEIQLAWMTAHPDVVLSSHQRLLAVDDQFPAFDGTVRGHRISGSRLLLSNRFQTSSVLMRRELPFRFDPDKLHTEDYLLWLRIVLSGYEAWELDAPLSFMYKAVYGAGGISGRLWRTEYMELATYNRIRRERLIGLPTQAALLPFSLGKFLVRLASRALR